MNKDKKLSPNEMKVTFLILACVFGFIYWFAQQLIVVVTPSIEPTVLFKIDGKAKKGEYVTFEFQHDFVNEDSFLLTKKVACYEGDILKVRESIHFFCNDEYLGFAKSEALDGKKMPLFNWNTGPIPEGKAFVIGEHLDSFDSRYWGFIELNKVQRLKEFI